MGSHEAYLRSALSKYRHPDMTKREVLNIFQNFSDLRPVVMNYVFNDGTKKELLCLDGTIPVTYKGKIYSIPLCMYLMDTHPYNPPIIYVKPTSTMQIKQGRHVDAAGRVYLPYLHEWNYPSSDLLGLIQIMSFVFGEESPVFSKQAVPSSSMPQYPMPLLPPGAGTLYPTTGVSIPMPNFPSSDTPSYPLAGGQYPQPTVQPYTGYPSYPPHPPQLSYPPGGYQQPYPSYPFQSQPYIPPAASQSAVANSNNMINDEQIRLSVLLAVEDKMKRRLWEVLTQIQAETDVLKRTQEDLQRGRQKLDDMLQRLEKEQNDVEQSIRLLRVKDDEIKVILDKLENCDEFSIDEVVVPTAPLYKQLLTAFAEEQATDDAIYYLGEALRKGVIELDVFLKQVRELSRKQFMLRMLIHKCRQKAGLPDIRS